MFTTAYTRKWALSSILLLWLSPAQGFDENGDRRGLFYGLSIGAAQTQVNTGNSKGHTGYTLRGRLGGGVERNLTIDAEIGLNQTNFEQFGTTIDQHFMSVAIGANFFLVGDWFVRLNGGISELTQSDDETDESNSETGLFLGGGTGYEFFVTPAIAVGLCADFSIKCTTTLARTHSTLVFRERH